MGVHKSETLPDVTYWLALEIAKVDPIVDLDVIYKGSLELDILYQLLTSKAQQHWLHMYGVQLSPIIINNARSEDHTSELQSPVPTSYAVFCLKKKKATRTTEKQ